ncbi:Aste57867_13426 [Aphanomyces stellatus]|uniref:Aste57867_13426 protein n=1 Tax=Aphanomyces stellatus TaxID=120398 RepID=A0A485KYL5_9STRA|nr:hypothetical protein As57867_013376 [Aphanomyces stellatus]VFT90265.1 Aste57867_13426 [Aphanomyces stellatus]
MDQSVAHFNPDILLTTPLYGIGLAEIMHLSPMTRRHFEKCAIITMLVRGGSAAFAVRRLFTAPSATSVRSLLDIYRDAVSSNEILEDQVQLKALQHLQNLQTELLATPLPAPVAKKDETTSFWDRFRTSEPAAPKKATNVPKGVYLYGGVGCGKTFIMDMFYDNLPLTSKRRVHFHKFMLEIHEKMHVLRKEGHEGDPIPHLAAELLETSRVLCFDEFQVTDVADALILRRLFSSMIDAGSIVVATSNRPPTDLYKNGLQRDLFLPFIDLLQASCVVHSLEASSTDYRKLKGQAPLHEMYRFPLSDERTQRSFFESFKSLANNEPVGRVTLRTQGRAVEVTQAAPKHKVCLVSFADMCDKPLGAADYLVIADAFHTVFLQDIPRLTVANRNQTRRFITFVDCMYDKKVQLYCLADAPPAQLLVQDDASKNVIDEVFAFDRTVSRLMEMQSESYGTLSTLELPTTSHRLAFLNKLKHKQLNYLDMKSIWDMYNVDRNDYLESHELQVLLEDVYELHMGNRDLPKEALQHFFHLRDTTDFKRFRRALTAVGLEEWWEIGDIAAIQARIEDVDEDVVPSEVNPQANWTV